MKKRMAALLFAKAGGNHSPAQTVDKVVFDR